MLCKSLAKNLNLFLKWLYFLEFTLHFCKMQVDTTLISVEYHVCFLLASLSYVFFNFDDCFRVVAIKLAVLMMLCSL